MKWEMRRWLHCSLPRPPPRHRAFVPKTPLLGVRMLLPGPSRGPCERFSLGSEAFVPPPEFLADKLAKQPGADGGSQRGGDAAVCASVCVSAPGSANATTLWPLVRSLIA